MLFGVYAPQLSWSLGGGGEPLVGGLSSWTVDPLFLLVICMLVSLCLHGWQLVRGVDLHGAGLQLAYVLGHAETRFDLAPPCVVFVALPYAVPG